MKIKNLTIISLLIFSINALKADWQPASNSCTPGLVERFGNGCRSNADCACNRTCGPSLTCQGRQA